MVNEIVYWVQSVNGETKERVKCYYKGTWTRDNANGMAGDMMLRPFALGPGPFTVTVGREVENEDGSPFDDGWGK